MTKNEARIMYIEILTSKLVGTLVSTVMLFVIHTHLIAINSVGNSLIVATLLTGGSLVKSYFIRKFFHPLYQREEDMRNRAKCLNCGDTLESKHVHDWISCTCFKQAERDLFEKELELGYIIPNKDDSSPIKYIENPNKPKDKEYYNMIKEYNCGIFIDGGSEYIRSGGNFNHMGEIADDK